MPTYTVENTKTGEVDTRICSFDTLQAELKGNPDLIHVIQGNAFISNRDGDQLRKAGNGWKDLLGRIKKHSGKNNTIRN